MYYFLTLINPQFFTALILAATITTATYIVTKNNSLQQVPPVDKDFKHSYDILGMDQIHPQYRKSVSFELTLLSSFHAGHNPMRS